MKTRKILQLEEDSKIVEVPVEEKTKSKKEILFNQATEVGFSIAVPICLGALLGVWLDNQLNSHPKFTLSLLFGGIFFAFFNLYRIVKTFSKSTKQKKQ